MRKSFLQIISDNFGLSEEKIEDARRIIEEDGDVRKLLISRNILNENQVLEALSLRYGIPFWPSLPLDKIDGEYIRQIPVQFLKKCMMVPLRALNGEVDSESRTGTERVNSGQKALSCIIAVNDPAAIHPFDDLVRILDAKDVQLVLATRDAILSAINLSHDFIRDSAEQLVQDMEENDSNILSQIEETADLLDDTSDAPIIKLVNHILSRAANARASDIHIEPYQDSFKVRYRIDGILYDLLSPPKWIQPALISRIKVMAKMNIAEKRLPQDGRFGIKIGEQDIDTRVSTIPTAFGERIVLRLLNKTSSLLQLSDLGLTKDRLDLTKNLIRSPNGIILVTGPTGSGKTTTLYAILSSIKTPDINIITIEDPVEYQIKGISQIQVNPKIELSFARGLRSIVRQDPDVILVGEIRDLETAEIAVQSALTGHLVFSTLHTNDSASAITRLVDIGVEPFLISSSVIAVIAQRLIRLLCNDCKEAFTPDDVILDRVGLKKELFKTHTIYRSVGCQNCFHTGFKGRIGIFEIMVLEDDLKTLILKSFDSSQIKSEALKKNMVTLRQDGIQKVLDGLTTIEEVVRVT